MKFVINEFAVLRHENLLDSQNVTISREDGLEVAEIDANDWEVDVLVEIFL